MLQILPLQFLSMHTAEAPIVIASLSDERSEKYAPERRNSWSCMRVRLSHIEVRKCLRANGSFLSATLAIAYCAKGNVNFAIAARNCVAFFSRALLQEEARFPLLPHKRTNLDYCIASCLLYNFMVKNSSSRL